MANSSDISDRIIEAVLAKKLLPGSRLGELPLALLFDCSRTIVREALTRLAARGIVTVSARRGWYLIEPTEDDAREAFEAREVIETGLIRKAKAIDGIGMERLREHMARQRGAIDAGDVGLRSFLLGDFHVCLADCLGNGLLADTLRDFTARTTLTAMRYQSDRDAAKSCAEHAQIVDALGAGNLVLAEQLMAQHLSTWQSKLPIPEESDPLERLRTALQPVDAAAPILHTSSPAGRTRKSRPTSFTSTST